MKVEQGWQCRQQTEALSLTTVPVGTEQSQPPVNAYDRILHGDHAVKKSVKNECNFESWIGFRQMWKRLTWSWPIAGTWTRHTDYDYREIFPDQSCDTTSADHTAPPLICWWWSNWRHAHWRMSTDADDWWQRSSESRHPRQELQQSRQTWKCWKFWSSLDSGPGWCRRTRWDSSWSSWCSYHCCFLPLSELGSCFSDFQISTHFPEILILTRFTVAYGFRLHYITYTILDILRLI